MASIPAFHLSALSLASHHRRPAFLRLSLGPHHLKPAAVLLSHSLKPTLPIPPRLRHRSPKPTTKPISCSDTPTPARLRRRSRKPTTNPIWCSDTPAPAVDRVISAASYFLPFFNGLGHGYFLFTKFPIIAAPFEPLFPLHSLYFSNPYAIFVPILALFLGVCRNPYLSRYARFNARQAMVLEVLLGIPVLLLSIITLGASGIGLMFKPWLHSGLFVFLVSFFIYGLVSSILGKTPYLRILSEAADLLMD